MSDEIHSGLEATIGAPPAVTDYPEMVTVDPKHYVLADEIARGGMGRIRIARDRRLGRRIAIKEILVSRADVARRFEREARITARLEHPSIVSVHEAGSWPTGEPFIAMRLVSGRSFDEVIAEAGTLPRRMALLPNVLAVADAIAYAHEQQIIHRDLKPKNVLVGKFGETVVIDWGLAKDQRDDDGTQDGASASALPVIVTGTEETLGSEPPAETSATLTVDGAVMGTPAYMPPEQARGERVDTRADVYAIGAILYHVLAGFAPISGTSANQALEDVIAGQIPELASLEPEVPADLLAIVDKAMARDQADRYPSARELAEDLRRFQTGQLVGAHRYSTGELVRKWLRRHRTAVVIGGLAVAVVGVIGVLSVLRILDERAIAQHERELALQSRTESEALVGFMLGDLRDQLEPLGRLDVLDSVTSRAVDYYDRRPRGDREQDAKHAIALTTRAAVLEAQGNLPKALVETQAALAIRRALVDAEPGNLTWKADLAASYRKLSDTLRAQGDSAGALAAARDALNAAASPRDLAAAHKRIADVLKATGDSAGALAEYRAALAVREELARSAPENLIWQRDLAINHERVGVVLQEQGELPAALASYRAGLAIAERLPAREPANKDRWRDVAIFHTRIGDALLAQGTREPALAAYREARAIAERMAGEDPTNVKWLRDLSISHGKIGDVLNAAGDRAGALVEYRAELAIASRLAAQDPRNAEWQRDLAISHETVAAVLLAITDRTGAQAEYRASLEIMTRLVAQDPSNKRWQTDLADTRAKLHDATK